MNKKELAIALSRLKPLKNTSAYLEQYATECEIAADVLWFAYLANDIKDKIIADFGCGNGILGIGALLLGARKVYFIDIDKKATDTAKENVEHTGVMGGAEFLQENVSDFNEKIDVVIQNPPFGVQHKHADREFLVAAFKAARIIYSFHKRESATFLKNISSDNKYNVTLLKTVKLPILKSMLFHRKKVYYVSIGVWKFAKEKL